MCLRNKGITLSGGGGVLRDNPNSIVRGLHFRRVESWVVWDVEVSSVDTDSSVGSGAW
jgi:hypothetical protein